MPYAMYICMHSAATGAGRWNAKRWGIERNGASHDLGAFHRGVVGHVYSCPKTVRWTVSWHGWPPRTHRGSGPATEFHDSPSNFERILLLQRQEEGKEERKEEEEERIACGAAHWAALQKSYPE